MHLYLYAQSSRKFHRLGVLCWQKNVVRGCVSRCFNHVPRFLASRVYEKATRDAHLSLSMDSLRLMSHVCDYNIPLLSCLSFDHSAALARLIKSKEERSSEALEPISLKPFIHCMDGRTESFFILPPSPCTLFHLGLRVLGPKASPPLHAHVFSTDRPSLLADDREEECIHCPRLRQLGKLTSEHGRGRRERYEDEMHKAVESRRD